MVFFCTRFQIAYKLDAYFKVQGRLTNLCIMEETTRSFEHPFQCLVLAILEIKHKMIKLQGGRAIKCCYVSRSLPELGENQEEEDVIGQGSLVW